jgi:hypothetical protein
VDGEIIAMKCSQFFVFTKYFYGHQIKEYDTGGISGTDTGSIYTILTKTWKKTDLAGRRWQDTLQIYIQIRLWGYRMDSVAEIMHLTWMKCQYHVRSI